MDQQKRHLRSQRHRRMPWGSITAAVLACGLVIYSLVRLIGYGSDLMSARRTAQALRQVYETVPTEAPVSRPNAPMAVSKTALPERTAAPTVAPMAVPLPGRALQSGAAAGYPDNPRLTVSSRFQSLQKESRYVIGWLTIPERLDEPVAQENNLFFLDHDAKGQPNVNGALFLDSAIGLKSRPDTYIIYGHNMKSGAMFGNLRHYTNSAFYRSEPLITFDTMYETGRYVVFAVGNVNTETLGRTHYLDLYSLLSSDVSTRQAAIDTLVSASVHTCTVDVQPEDQLLILVTCVDNDAERRVVAARRVRNGEDEGALKAQVEKSRSR
ncbi:MAG: class B sortase [Clostridia bacterium]|nr:class B sortase [Clostridia bacterium]